MKLRLLSMLLASSMAAGNFTMPVGTYGWSPEAFLMRTGATEDTLPEDRDALLTAELSDDSGGGELSYGLDNIDLPDDYDNNQLYYEYYGDDLSADAVSEGYSSDYDNIEMITDSDNTEEDLLTSNEASELSDESISEEVESIPEEVYTVFLQDEEELLSELNEELADDPGISGNAMLSDTAPDDSAEVQDEHGNLPADGTEDAESLKIEEVERGGYEFAGYIDEDIPNFVWVGEGAPSMIGSEYVFDDKAEDEQFEDKTGNIDTEKIFASSEHEVIIGMQMQSPLLIRAAPAASGGNYIANTPGRAYRGYRNMSQTTDSTMPDGLHTDTSGMVRAYKDGRYFMDGGFALDGVTYFADEDGYLVKGWLKTIIGSLESVISSVKDDTKFAFRFFDRSSCEMKKGYHNIDGLWHYFDDRGIMTVNRGLTIEGNYYYADRYGICEQIKLRYGNVMSSELYQNNDMYLANKSVEAVDITTFSGQNGEYSFRPKWQKDQTTLELFGFDPEESSDSFYCTLRDQSLAGKIGCVYRNVGRYMGREVDLRLTVTEYELFSLSGDTEVGYFSVYKNKIGLNNVNTRSITADMEFLDHESGKLLTLKGYATFSDIDIGQSVTILSPVDAIYVDKDCVLYKDPDSLSFTAPFIAERVGSVVTDDNRENWVQVNYTCSRLTYRFGSAYEQYVYAQSGNDIAGEARDIWVKSYSGNPADYSILRTDGSLYNSWQGLHYKRLGRISIPPVSKTVTDEDENKVTENRLGEDELSYLYTLSHNVPAESEEYFYSAYSVSDVFEDGLIIDKDDIWVTDDNDNDVTARFDITVEGQKAVFSAKKDMLLSDSFYDNNYHYNIPVTIKEVEALKNRDGDDYVIYNQCTAEFTRSSGDEKSDSNRTITRIQVPYHFGEIAIIKRILEKDIVWAHGNPTFLFCAEGTDEKGVFHRYEEYICFTKENYSVSGDYAEVKTVISHVPCGTYEVYELPVIDYYLSGAEALTTNMSITVSSEPGRGKDPKAVAFGTASLTREKADAGIAFTDTKGDYHGYRQTDVVKNNIPVAFDTET